MVNVSAVFDTPKKHFLKNIMPWIKKERKVVPLEESPDDGSLEGREPQDTDSSKGGRHNLRFRRHQQRRNKWKKQRTAPLILTDEPEKDLAVWLKLNNFLYMKSKREYKDVALKKCLWDKKVAEFFISYLRQNTETCQALIFIE